MKDERRAHPEHGLDQEIQGILLAHETLLTHLIWRFAMGQPHPPTALSAYLRPIEEKMAHLLHSQSIPQGIADAAHATTQQIARQLEKTLHVESLRRAKPKGTDH